MMLAMAAFYSCKATQFTDQDSSVSSWFNRSPDTQMTLPITNETIDTHKYRMDQKTRDKVISLRPEAVMDASNVALQKLNDLDFSEAAAIQGYTEMDYRKFAALFAPDDTPGIKVLKTETTVLLFKSTISAINGMERFQGTVFFGQVMPKEYVDNNLRKGDTFSNNNFLSTTLNKEVAEKFARKKVNDSNKISVIFEVQNSCHGRDISRFSEFPFEKEVLFLPLHPFKVVDAGPISGNKNFYSVKLQEIFPCSGSLAQSSVDFPYCRTKQTFAKIFGDSRSSKTIGLLKPGIVFTAFAKVNDRYAVFSDALIDPEAQKCVDSKCLKKVTDLQTVRPDSIVSIDETKGIPFSNSPNLAPYNREQPIGVVLPGTEITATGQTPAASKSRSLVVLEGFIEIDDVEMCSSSLPK